jgi:hypothetical protein
MSEDIVHEGVHADWRNKGLASNLYNTEEGEYVDNKFAEEADAYAKQYEFTNNSGLTSHIPQEMQEAYNKGFQEGAQDYLLKHPDATEKELEDAGKEGARKELVDFLKHAELEDGGTYEDIFQQHWREAHPDLGEGTSGPK